MIKNRRPASPEQLTFHYETYEEWFEIHEDTRFDVGSPDWMNFTIQTIDYLANDAILKKNDDVIKHFLSEQMAEILKENSLFKEVRAKVTELREDCYDIEIDKR